MNDTERSVLEQLRNALSAEVGRSALPPHIQSEVQRRLFSEIGDRLLGVMKVRAVQPTLLPHSELYLTPTEPAPQPMTAKAPPPMPSKQEALSSKDYKRLLVAEVFKHTRAFTLIEGEAKTYGEEDVALLSEWFNANRSNALYTAVREIAGYEADSAALFNSESQIFRAPGVLLRYLGLNHVRKRDNYIARYQVTGDIKRALTLELYIRGQIPKYPRMEDVSA